MTKDQYLRMVEQTGEEIDWERCPPDAEDFPESVVRAMNIFNSLGDRVFADIGYVGKDFTTLDLLYDLYKVEEHDKDCTFELILFLDNRTREESQKKMKAEYDKLKKK